MKQVIKLTLLTTIGSCIIMFILLIIVDSFGMGLYASILTFGNILLPTLGAVLIYKLIKAKTTLKKDIWTVTLQAIILAGFFTLGLYIWAVCEAAIYKTLTWTDAKAVYESEFSGFLPIVFSEAVLIPLLDKVLIRSKFKINRQ